MVIFKLFLVFSFLTSAFVMLKMGLNGNQRNSIVAWSLYLSGQILSSVATMSGDGAVGNLLLVASGFMLVALVSFLGWIGRSTANTSAK